MSKVRVEVIESSPGQYRWRVRNADGKIVPIKIGKIMGLGGAAKQREARKAANTALGQLAKQQRKPKGRSQRILAAGR